MTDRHPTGHEAGLDPGDFDRAGLGGAGHEGAGLDRAGHEGAGYEGAGLDRGEIDLTGAVELRVPDGGDMRALGVWLAGALRAGDLVLLTGPLGAGKTTLTQGIGEGLGVRGPITSPTFVIARVHPSTVGGPDLVHVDAYRLGDTLEVDDLDLDAAIEESVTVVEWGEGLAEGLAENRLEVQISRATDDVRTVTLTGVGPRWTAQPSISPPR